VVRERSQNESGQQRLTGLFMTTRAAGVLLLCLLSAAAAEARADERYLTDEAAIARVLDLADQRLALMPAVAATKWRTHAPISDPAREKVVIQHAGELAAPLGLAGEPVERVFQIQIRLAVEVETHLTDGWTAHGFNYPEPIPELATQLRPQIDRVTTQLLRSLYLAAPVTAQPQFVARFSSLATQRLHGAGWSDGSRLELLTALADIRQTDVPALQRIGAAGVVRIGVTGDYAPFSLDNHGVLAGADIELAKALAAHLKAEPVFIHTSWKSLLDDLHQNRFDLAMSGISITPERQARAEFSIPYASGGKTLIARCTDVARYHDLASVDQRGVRVVVNPGGTNEQYARANIHKAKITVHQDNTTIFDEIRAGKADVMITDDTEVELQTHRHPDLCRPNPATLTHADKAILLPRDAAFVSAVNEWLQAEIKAGEPASLLRRQL
jgi:cyclohexadienyl dehydratase